MKRIGSLVLLSGLLAWGAGAQDGVPEVSVVAPKPDAIVQDSVFILVQAENFKDLQTFGFADFFYESVGKSRQHLGVDSNTIDGLSFLWDTAALPDGRYELIVEVTDLFNNEASGTTTVYVNNNGNQSFSSSVSDNLISALESLALALDFPADLPLADMVQVIQSNLENAVITIQAAVTQTQAILDTVPEVIADTDPFLALTPALDKLGKTILITRTALSGLDLDGAKAGLTDMVDAIRELSRLRPNGLDFSPLALVADGVVQVTEQVDALLLAVQGESGGAVDEALSGFVEVSRGVVPEVLRVSQALKRANNSGWIRFETPDGISVHFQVADGERLIRVGGNPSSGHIELFDAGGVWLLDMPLAQGQFHWDGRSADGETLGPGNYYFVMRLQEAQGEVVKTGRIVVMP